MTRGMTKDELKQEWDDISSKDWYSIYNWKPISSKGYTEWISEWLFEEFTDLRLIEDGLRESKKFNSNHQGLATLKHEDKETAEKMFCRAIFNQQKVEGLGTVLDYEVPLKQTRDAKHGDVDLLFLRENELLCVEAKWRTSTESILKAILESFVYARLLNRRRVILSEYKLAEDTRLRPIVLTFESATSGQQLTQISEYPILFNNLRSSLNQTLDKEGIGEIEFRFAVLEDEHDTPWERRDSQGSSHKILFSDGVELITKPAIVG